MTQGEVFLDAPEERLACNFSLCLDRFAFGNGRELLEDPVSENLPMIQGCAIPAAEFFALHESRHTSCCPALS
jgi:hypothetical protein